MGFELVTVLRSNHLPVEDYVEEYLKENPNLSFFTVIKIVFRSYLTSDKIIQFNEFKDHLKSVDFCLFEQVFKKVRRIKRYW